ncbi:MAG: hypothetical protein GTN78_01955 [Gemmatimonadales bacterium]|nr:hypothetical protein [Gemmatimonadales bacterium]NIN10725.1 hypothetical protein [Gemmatimonadales bacterium]NIQ98955.1 hypothetical protein [Gemmatimonadales bacterium]NIS63774.1 hypothetical protein [Gemmatimonadales bacterium]
MTMKEAGFTLISVMIALILLAVGIMALSRAGGEVLAARSAAATRTTAVAIGRAYMETLRSRDPATLSSESAVKVNDTGAADPNGQYTRTVEVESTGENLVRVRVLIDAPRSQEPVELVTLVYVGAVVM